MDLRNDDRHVRIDPTGLARLRSLDMAVATRTSLPVLISAPAEYALPMAIEIAAGPGGTSADDVVVVDAADNRSLSSTLTRASAADRGPIRAIVLQDVEWLDQAQQSALMALVADTDHPGSRACRIIATTSVPLFERVIQGSFDSDLFYRLNRIHIKVAAAGSQGH
jgi:Sigma-54 interaction domain